MRVFLVFILLLVSVGSGIGDADDFGFTPVRRKLRYVEEFYRLFARNHMASTDSIGRNIVYFQYALNSPFIHPSQALCEIQTRKQHARYRLLMRCRIAFIAAKSIVRYGYRWDKQDILYYNLEFKKELKKSFKIAEYYYKDALVYWKEAKRVAALAIADRYTRLKGALIESIIDEAWRINRGLINYEKVIRFRLRELDRKNKKLDTLK